MNRRAEIERRAGVNAHDLEQNGPRNWYGRQTWIAGKSADGDRVLLGGLGAMGVGQMWFDATPLRRQDATYEQAPIMEEA